MKKTKLVTEEVYDFKLYGIVSSVKCYQLAWAFNQKLQINLKRLEDYNIEFEADNAVFMYYSYTKNECKVEVFQNQSLENISLYMVPEYIHFDYIIKIKRCFQTISDKELIKQLVELSYIEYISAISPLLIKSRNNFLE